MPAQERAGIYDPVIAGEMIGAGIGFFVFGEVLSFASWRWSFFVMASPAGRIAGQGTFKSTLMTLERARAEAQRSSRTEFPSDRPRAS